jgi:hypothetical protein
MKAAPWITLGIVAAAMLAVAFVRNRNEDAKPQANAAPPATSTIAAPVAAPRAHRAMPTAQEAEQAREQAVRSLETRMVEEARDAAWAADNERHIDAFFDAGKLAKAGVPPAASHDVECRTHVCRVRMRVDSDLGADQTTQALLQHIAQSLPNAQIFQQDDARGADIVVYAQAPAATPSRGAFGRPR